MDQKALAALLFPDVTETPEDLEARYPARDLPEGAVVTRMAPSPTGFVHLGNLVQGLVAERMAHQSGGVLFLRVEDTDAKREVPGAVEVLINTLKHYGIHFDEGATIDGDSGAYGPYRQRQRAAIYHVYAKQLVLQGDAYPCFCTEEELTAMRAEQEAKKVNFGYYGEYAVWRDRPIEDVESAIAAGKPWVLRFRSTGSIENKFKYSDLVKGTLTVTENDIDQVLLKSDGIPTYHFAHAVDDHLMRTTHVVRGDEWLPSLPFHLQLFRALGFRIPKYVHIGPLMKMDGTSKRKLSKRKDPELALTYYKAEGFPVRAVYEYVMTLLNSNYEDWRKANPTASSDDFKFSCKKLNPAGALFDYAKLCDVSKNEIARLDAAEVYDLALEYAKEFDPDFAAALESDPEYARSILAIGRGGKKPRKDLTTWKDVRPYMAFFYDGLFTPGEFPAQFDGAVVRGILEKFLQTYDPADDAAVWFDKVKALTAEAGFCADMKAYKADPAAWPGSVADVSTFLRIAVTGKDEFPGPLHRHAAARQRTHGRPHPRRDGPPVSMGPRMLDLAAYPRRAHFDYFRQMANPYLSVTAPCDITALRRLTQERGLPFFLTVLHCAINAANAVPELRQRIRGEGIVEYDRCLSSHTVALPDGTYCYCTLDCAQPLGAFLPAAQAEVARVKAAPSLDDGADPDELFFVSSLPWLTFSAISLPTPTPADSNPRITFGKFTQEGDRVLLPVNLTANHALVDGLHLAAFFDGMAQRAAHPEEYF